MEAEGVPFKNHDVRADGLSEDIISQIVTTLGWEKALNRRSTTWRNLDEEQKADLDNATAASLIAEHPTLLKRPVFVDENEIIAGYGDEAKQLCLKDG